MKTYRIARYAKYTEYTEYAESMEDIAIRLKELSARSDEILASLNDFNYPDGVDQLLEDIGAHNDWRAAEARTKLRDADQDIAHAKKALENLAISLAMSSAYPNLCAQGLNGIARTIADIYNRLDDIVLELNL